MSPPVSFIIPVRDDRERLERCLRTIRANASHGAQEIIVLDNGSKDGSAAVAIDAGARVSSLAGLSVAQLRNKGAAIATDELLAFVDADHEIVPEWVQAAVQTLQDPTVAAVGAPYHDPPNGTWVQRIYGGFRKHAPGTREVDWLASGNLVIRKAAFEAIGGFDVSLESCEDVDLCYRLRAAGYRLLADARMTSVHFGDPPTLTAVFASELWRGRDNFRVTIRTARSVRDLVSLMIPIAQLALAMVAIGGLILITSGGGRAIAFALFGIFALTGLRAIDVVRRLGRVGPLTLLQAFLVTGAYDAGRALALITRASHRMRRIGASQERKKR